jgi:hypothetical protein
MRTPKHGKFLIHTGTQREVLYNKGAGKEELTHDVTGIVDPDPALFVSCPQDAKRYIYIILQRQNSRIKVIFLFLLDDGGIWIPTNNDGSGSGRSKNIRIQLI